MQANLLANILAPQKVDSEGSQLFSGKKIDSAEAELFAKLLQGSIDIPVSDRKEKGFADKELILDPFAKQDSLAMGEEDSVSPKDVSGLVDNQNVVNLFGENNTVLNPQTSEQEVTKIIASHPRLIQIFEKTDRPDELIVRLRDLMIQDPKTAAEVGKVLKQVESGDKQALELLKLAKSVILGGTAILPQNVARIHATKVAEYGQNQATTNKNLITPKKRPMVTNKLMDMISSPSASEEKIIPIIDRTGGRLAQPIQAPTAKVLDLSGISVNNGAELINKISNYVQQSNFQNRQSLDLTVKHDDLGQFKINVSKMRTGDHLDLQITTSTREGRSFFVQNESRLAHSLEMSGIKLVDIKIIAGTEFAKMDSENRGSQQEQSNNQHKGSFQHHADKNGADADSRRRRDLWEMYKERNAA